ncbi:MAG: YqgE/AlgH family protein [Bacteroidota bacterium]
MVRHEIKTGKVLLAEPFMLDPNFKRSAVLLCEHSEEGSVGFIMNKPIKMRIDELMDGFPEFESEVLFGGPVQTDTIHYVHTVGELLDNSIHVMNNIYWGGDFDKLKFLISSKLIQPKDIRFFVGYSGWSEGQLVDEIKSGSWILADMDTNYLFQDYSKEMWQKVLEDKGNAYSVIAHMPEIASWN